MMATGEQGVSKEQHMAVAEELAEVKGSLEQLRVRHERLIDEYSSLYAEHTTVGEGRKEGALHNCKSLMQLVPVPNLPSSHGALRLPQQQRQVNL
jgi:hypothetical protein